MKRIISVMLSAVMCFSSVSLSVNAADDTAILAEQLDMPVISLTTSGGISSKENYVDASVSIYDENGTAQMTDSAVSVRLRGNSTLNTGKKSYKLKFPSKKNVLNIGDGSGKTWNLVANAYDTSMLRNMAAYELGNMLDCMPYTPNCKSVEVYLNGSYQGVYLLTEAVGINKSRINIPELPDEVENTGYLIEMSRYAQENYFDVDLQRYEIKNDLSENAEIKSAQEQYISKFIDTCYNAVKNGDRADIETLIDVDSFVDIYIASEIVKNVDAGWDSFYIYKNVGGKLTFGPMCDFDLALGNFIDVKGFDSWQGLNVYDTANISSNSNPWFCYIIRQKWFRELVVSRWNEKINKLESLDEFVMNEAEENLASYDRNCKKWSTIGKQVFSEPKEIWSLQSWSDHAEYLAKWLESRVNWLDSYFNSDDFDAGIFPDEDGKEISEDANIAEYSTKFMMLTSDYVINDTPSCSAKIPSGGWMKAFQMCMSGIMLENGQKYVVSFDCSSDSSTTVTFKIQQNYGSYRAYISKSTTASSEIQHFEYEFTSDVFDTNCAMILEGSGTAGAEVNISNICMRKVAPRTVKGDIDGDGRIDVFDMVFARRGILNGFASANAEDAADVDNNGIVEVADLVQLQGFILGKIKSFTPAR